MLNIALLNLSKTPVSGVDSVQTLTVTGAPTGGTFTLTFGGQTTAAIPFNETAANIQVALQALSSIGANNILCTGASLTAGITCRFAGTLGGLAQAAITHTDSLTGGATPAVAVAQTSAGVQGSYRGISPGAVVIDTTNGNLYSNSGNAPTPVWTAVSPI